MDDLIRQTLNILRGTWRWRWLGIGAAWVFGVAGILALGLIKDKYEATARIQVNTESVLKPLLKDLTVDLNLDQQVAMLSRTLITRPNVEKLVRMANLDPDGKGGEGRISDIISRLQLTTAGRDPRENLFILTYRDNDATRAKQVVEALGQIFLESNRTQNRQDSAEAKAFIESEIKSYEKRLEEAENRLKDFKVRHLGQSEVGGDYFRNMTEINTRLDEARLQLREAENSRDALRRQIAGEEPALGGPAPEIDSRIDALRRNLDGLLQKFTDQHPDVVGAKRVLAELQEQKRRQVAARAKGGAGSEMTSDNANPVYQELKVALARADANVASLRTRVAEYDARYRQLTESAKMVPEMQAEFAKLNRDYEVNKKNYETLLARRESADISGKLQDTSAAADFRLVDPPRVSDKPVGPNRLMLLPLVLLGTLGAGIGVCFVADRVWPVCFDGRSLRDLTGLPVVGTVLFRGNEQTTRISQRRMIAFFSALGGLIALYGVTLTIFVLTSARTV
ncbi:MAG: XrtA system polysaccharide chain length determinant [Rhodocyclaceae bacterium]|jgi:polysaccharide chain length determinant protein (PEP-CTERM system associated)